MAVFLREFWLFGLKQAWACLFAGILLAAVIVTRLWWPQGWPPRYDALFALAVVVQATLLLLRLEEPREALVILVFHVVATAMEVFKTSDAIGSWSYPGEAWLRIGHVPLFAGFMYSAVGSYIARVWRIFDFRFTRFPPLWLAALLALLAYANFFTHHYIIDLRYPLLVGVLAVFGRTWVHYRIDQVHRRMPLVLGLTLVALFIWFAANLATWSNIWLYPSQLGGWTPVSPAKLLAWLLLMLISFVLVALVHRPQARASDRHARSCESETPASSLD